MAKINERKKYKFSEIIAMLENEELPDGTILVSEGIIYRLKFVDGEKVNLITYAANAHSTGKFYSDSINTTWNIKAPLAD